MNIAPYIEHTLLGPATTVAEVEQACADAQTYGFASVCVPPLFVKTARALLPANQIKLVTVIGFPLGYSVIEAKLAELIMAIVDGADELDMVININAVKNNDWQYLAKEITTLMPIVKGKGKIINLIIEAGAFTTEEIITCCDIYGAAGADAIVTGSGYGGNELSIDMVQLLRKHLPSVVKIKAAGGIKNYNFATQLLAAGADRLCCPNGITIVQEYARQN